MEQIAKIGDYITMPDCATTGTVRYQGIRPGREGEGADVDL